jgi:hypothetical protein
VTTYVALALAGAASLGAFEGGAVAAIVTGLQASCAGESPAVAIDVICGASSGAITGLLAAHALANGTDAVATLHDAWVTSAGLASLRGRGFAAPLSLAGARATAGRLFTSGPPGVASLRQNEPISLELALTSLRGSTRGDSTAEPSAGRGQRSDGVRQLRDRRYLAWSPFTITAAIDEIGWMRAVESALGSAANPAVFPARLVEPGSQTEDAEGHEHRWPPGFYTDGGTLVAEPVGRADEVGRRRHDERQGRRDESPGQPGGEDGSEPGDSRLVLLVHPFDLVRPAGPDWQDGEVPPTWLATLSRSLEIQQSHLLAEDLRRVLSGHEDPDVAVVSPDLCDHDQQHPGDRLSGYVLANFGGFLSLDRRQHDFDLGYRCGQAWLQQPATALQLGLGGSPGALTDAQRRTVSAYSVVRRDRFTRPSGASALRRSESMEVARLGARVVGVIAHDMALSRRRAQTPPRRFAPRVAPAQRNGSLRWIHQIGVSFDAKFTMDSVVPSIRAAFEPSGPFSSNPRPVEAKKGGPVQFDAIVRFSRFASRGFGSEFVGMATRLIDPDRGDQDLLFMSSHPDRISRHMFWPADLDLTQTSFSTVSRLDVAGERLLFGARAEDAAKSVAFADLTSAAPALVFRIEAARFVGAWYSVGTLELTRWRSESHERFRPTNSWPRITALKPDLVRDRVYMSSEEGKPAPWALGGWFRWLWPNL